MEAPTSQRLPQGADQPWPSMFCICKSRSRSPAGLGDLVESLDAVFRFFDRVALVLWDLPQDAAAESVCRRRPDASLACSPPGLRGD